MSAFLSLLFVLRRQFADILTPAQDLFFALRRLVDDIPARLSISALFFELRRLVDGIPPPAQDLFFEFRRLVADTYSPISFHFACKIEIYMLFCQNNFDYCKLFCIFAADFVYVYYSAHKINSHHAETGLCRFGEWHTY